MRRWRPSSPRRWGVARAQVSVERGAKGRLKAVAIEGVEAADLERAFGRAEK